MHYVLLSFSMIDWTILIHIVGVVVLALAGIEWLNTRPPHVSIRFRDVMVVIIASALSWMSIVLALLLLFAECIHSRSNKKNKVMNTKEFKVPAPKNKVVYNDCCGSFKISLNAMKWLAKNGRDEIKAIAEKRLQKFPDGEEYSSFNCWNIQRHDPDLVRCVETLGSKASGRFAELKVHELKGNRYSISDYDGWEEVYEPEDESYITIKELSNA